MSDVGTQPEPKITITRQEYARLKWFENGMRRLWFFFAGIIPAEWRDETMQRWIKLSADVKKPSSVL